MSDQVLLNPSCKVALKMLYEKLKNDRFKQQKLQKQNEDVN